MQNEPKKPSRVARVFNTLFPFKKPAQAAMRPAVDGLEIVNDLLTRIKHEVNPALTPEVANLTPAEKFRRQCQRYGLDKRALQNMELAFMRTKRVYLSFFYLLPVVGLALAINATTWADQVSALGCALFAPVALVMSTRLSFRLRSLRRREGLGWREFCATFPTKAAMALYFVNPEF